MNISKKSKVKGFSLLEVLMYVSVSSVLLFSMTLFITFLLGSRVKSETIANVNYQGEQVMRLLTTTIRNGTSVISPSIGTGSASLSVTVTDPSLSPTVFDVSSGTIRIKEGGGPIIPLTNSRVVVSPLLFENVSSSSSTEKSIRISFTISHNNASGRSEYSYSRNFIGSATMK
jgi:hypothetical protein